ncbi:hypothetical protein HK102_000883 [Quaeritorhiza haematococci]|nr:hypothetical protein HK102_000883 [Quaeritorhiza haematococci]
MYVWVKYPFDPQPTINIHIDPSDAQRLPISNRIALENGSYDAVLADLLPGRWEGYYGYGQALDICDRPMILEVELEEENKESAQGSKTVVDGIAGDVGAFRAFKGKGEDQWGLFTITGRVVLATGKIFSRKAYEVALGGEPTALAWIYEGVLLQYGMFGKWGDDTHGGPFWLFPAGGKWNVPKTLEEK